VSRFNDDDINFDFFAAPERVEDVDAGRLLPRLRRSRSRGSGEGLRRPPASLPPGLVPLARLAALIAITIAVVVALVFWVGACQGTSKHDEYASYASKVRGLAQSSQSLGVEFANKLIAPGLKQADLETSLQAYAQQEQQAYDQAQRIRAPGPVRSIHQNLVDALELRAKGLAALGDALSQTATAKDPSAAAQKLTDEAALLTTSDVVWDQLYQLPATEEMKALGVTGVVIPESHFVANADLVSARSFGLLLQRLHPVSTGSAPTPLLKPGNSGAAVGIWQVQLNRWLKKAQPQQALVVVTRVFDAATEAATKTLQIAASITPDGIVGPATRQALTRELAH
jgi:Putative peptidoglycan binding domain